jgi:hypothetical protein
MPISHGTATFLIACASALLVQWLSKKHSERQARRHQRRPATPRRHPASSFDANGGEFDYATANAANQHLFTHRHRRALVDTELHALVDAGAFEFHLTNPVPQTVDLHAYVQPASIDLPVTGSAFLVKEKVLPFRHRVVDLLHDLTLERKPLVGDGVVLLKGQTYLVYCGTVNLPPNTKGCLSPKSSIGRVDLLVRGVVDGIGLYDTVPGGSKRSLWLEITPRSFNVRIKEGLALTQLMVFRSCDDKEEEDERAQASSIWQRQRQGQQRGEAGEGEGAEEEDEEHNQRPLEGHSPLGAAEAYVGTEGQTLIFNEAGEPLPHQWENGALVLCLNVPQVTAGRARSGGHLASNQQADTIVGYEAIGTNEVVDLSCVGGHPWHKYFRRIELRDLEEVGGGSASGATGVGGGSSGGASSPTAHLHLASNRRLTLEKDRFYILATKVRCKCLTAGWGALTARPVAPTQLLKLAIVDGLEGGGANVVSRMEASCCSHYSEEGAPLVTAVSLLWCSLPRHCCLNDHWPIRNAFRCPFTCRRKWFRSHTTWASCGRTMPASSTLASGASFIPFPILSPYVA